MRAQILPLRPRRIPAMLRGLGDAGLNALLAAGFATGASGWQIPSIADSLNSRAAASGVPGFDWTPAITAVYRAYADAYQSSSLWTNDTAPGDIVDVILAYARSIGAIVSWPVEQQYVNPAQLPSHVAQATTYTNPNPVTGKVIGRAQYDANDPVQLERIAQIVRFAFPSPQPTMVSDGATFIQTPDGSGWMQAVPDEATGEIPDWHKDQRYTDNAHAALIEMGPGAANNFFYKYIAQNGIGAALNVEATQSYPGGPVQFDLITFGDTLFDKFMLSPMPYLLAMGAVMAAAGAFSAGASGVAEGTSVATGSEVAAPAVIDAQTAQAIASGWEGAVNTSAIQNAALAEITGQVPAGTLAQAIGAENAASALADATQIVQAGQSFLDVAQHAPTTPPGEPPTPQQAPTTPQTIPKPTNPSDLTKLGSQVFQYGSALYRFLATPGANTMHPQQIGTMQNGVPTYTDPSLVPGLQSAGIFGNIPLPLLAVGVILLALAAR